MKKRDKRRGEGKVEEKEVASRKVTNILCVPTMFGPLVGGRHTTRALVSTKAGTLRTVFSKYVYI